MFLLSTISSIMSFLCFSPETEVPEPELVQQRKQQLPTVPNPPAISGTASHPPSLQNTENIHPDPVRQLLQDELFRLVQVRDKLPFMNSCSLIVHKIRYCIYYNIVLCLCFSCSKSTL